MTNQARNELLAVALSNEAQLWFMAMDYEQLRSMWEQRITKEFFGLTDAQERVVGVAQAGMYALAMQQVAVRMMGEMAGMLRVYTALKMTESS